MRPSIPLTLFAALGAGAFCRPAPQEAAADPAAAAAADSTELARLRAEVTAAIGDPVCTDVSQCRAIAFGAKPCGGPREYLVYSMANADSLRLDSLVSRYNAVDREMNQSGGMVSDCSVVMPPVLERVDGRCVVGDGQTVRRSDGQ
ncbi:MAG: hypothetical protein AB7Q69_11450 [Gemmatimonadales bacterium]